MFSLPLHEIPHSFRRSRENVPFKDLSLPGRVRRISWKATKWGYDGNLIGLPLLAVSLASSKRGEFIPTAAAEGFSFAAFPLVQGAVAAGLALIPGLGEGALIVGSMFLGAVVTSSIENGIQKGVRTFTEFGRKYSRLEYGGGFVDSDSSYQQRLRGAQEMSAALLSSRRFLGQEARFLHT
jgi:hypothetical protein